MQAGQRFAGSQMFVKIQKIFTNKLTAVNIFDMIFLFCYNIYICERMSEAGDIVSGYGILPYSSHMATGCVLSHRRLRAARLHICRDNSGRRHHGALYREPLTFAQILFDLAAKHVFQISSKQKPKGSRAWFKKLGVVYQNPDYQLFMPTVRQEISFGAKNEEYAAEIADLFGVKHLWERHPQSLSEGQKRRVSIAAVAACAPEVLLLDEPTVGQDYDGLCALVERLNKLHMQSGNTMITITHDVRCAEALCGKAYLIADSTVSAQGGKELVRTYFTL